MSPSGLLDLQPAPPGRPGALVSETRKSPPFFLPAAEATAAIEFPGRGSLTIGDL